MDQPDAKRARMRREERSPTLPATSVVHSSVCDGSVILTELAKMERGLQQQREMMAVLMANQETILGRLGAGMAEGNGLARTVEKIGRDIDAVARNQYELRKENAELRQLNKDGYFNFAVRVNGEDFLAFAVIMALGNRKAAADHLKIPHRSFYDRVNLWARDSKDHQRMFRLIEWRKKVGRKILVRLEDSVQSGEPNDEPENPVTVAAVLEGIAASDQRDYPAILREILEVLVAQNPKNWSEMGKEAIGIIKEEIG